jgi:leucine dehydrogenase
VPALLEGKEREGLFRRYSDAIASLGGSFWTGCDMNTTPGDLDVIAEHCPYVFGRSVESGGSCQPGPSTARGVLYGIQACLTHIDGSPSLEGRSVLVQGVGSVGARLSELLTQAGARVLVSDIAMERSAELGERVGAQVVLPEHALETGCDVYAPCAPGGTLSADTVPRLRCRVVAGSANNQLATPEDADRLRERGILYAPDFVINAGGAFYNAGTEALGWDAAQVEQALRGIGDTLAEIFRRSETEGTPPGAWRRRLPPADSPRAIGAPEVLRPCALRGSDPARTDEAKPVVRAAETHDLDAPPGLRSVDHAPVA